MDKMKCEKMYVSVQGPGSKVQEALPLARQFSLNGYTSTVAALGKKTGNCSIMPGNSAWIAERAGVRRYDFVDNAQHFQVIPTKVGIQMFFFGVRLPSVIEQLRKPPLEP
jgi:hypothetical protein